MRQIEETQRGARAIALGPIASARALGGLSALSIAITTVAESVAVSHGAATVVVSTTKNTQLGTILVSGKTLCVLNGTAQPCTGTCATAWPPHLLPRGVHKATAGSGVARAKLGTVNRNGNPQVTYAGKELHHFSGNHAAGKVNGNGSKDLGRTRGVVVAARAAKAASTTNGGTTAGNTGGGYGY